MTLRRVTLLIVLLATIAYVAVLFTATRATVLRSFSSIEAAETREHVRRARDTLASDVESLSAKSSDWSAWDDSYRFIEDTNKEFKDSNFSYQSLVQIEVDAMLFYKPDGSLVYGCVIDDAGNSLAPPSCLMVSEIASHPSLVSHTATTSVVAGLMTIASEPWLICSRPIVTSSGAGPIRGSLVFARRLSPDYLASLAQRIHLRMTIETAAAGGPAPGPEPTIKVLNDDAVQGSVAFADVFGRPTYVLTVQTPRWVYRQGVASANFLLASIAVCGGLIGVALVASLRWTVQRPIEAMVRDLRQITRDLQNDRDVHVGGVSEIRELATAMNVVLHAHQKARRTLDQQTRTLKARTSELTVANAQAEAAIKSKNEFFASISHEIRTPMTAILGYADMLAEESVTPEERQNCVATIRRNGETLLSMIGDILDLAKLEASGMRVELRAINPVEVATDAFELLRPIAAKKNLSYTLSIAPDTPTRITGDSIRLKQILVNLIGNALKFTESGSVHVNVHPSANTARHLLVEVVDTGIGMTAQQMSGLFQPFAQADDSTARRFGGTGLGLTISKRLAQLMTGDISVLSESGRGSRFTLALQVIVPADPASAPPPLPGRVDAPVPTGEAPARVLLAEDGEDNRRLLVHILSKAGMRVDVVANGVDAVEAALESLRADPFDLVLMDMSMPMMDGYEATQVLRRRGYAGPILALTAHSGSEQIKRCLDAGCDAYASKPVAKDEFLALCRKWISGRGRRAAA